MDSGDIHLTGNMADEQRRGKHAVTDESQRTIKAWDLGKSSETKYERVNDLSFSNQKGSLVFSRIPKSVVV